MVFSVIVPFLNEALYIRDCADSLLRQDFDKSQYEIIFIDNGSTDRSLEILRAFSGITVLRENKKYEFAARNTGMRAAKGKIFACTNADCVASCDWLSQIYRGITEEDVSIVLGRIEFASKDKFLLGMFEDYEAIKLQYVFNNCGRRYLFANANNMAVKAEVFKKVGPFVDWHRGGDTELLHRYLSFDPGAKVKYLPNMNIEHREITTTFMWLKKISVNAENNKIVEVQNDYRALGSRVKLEVYKCCSRINNYGLFKRTVLFILLIVGNLFYKLGELRGYYKAHFLYKINNR
ncbi:MAG: glycosyltransferase [Candidatus Omnitrophica bacterium]|nr:glycosyltransferase [Candidatus Omnitrophota bacterium]